MLVLVLLNDVVVMWCFWLMCCEDLCKLWCVIVLWDYLCVVVDVNCVLLLGELGML